MGPTIFLSLAVQRTPTEVMPSICMVVGSPVFFHLFTFPMTKFRTQNSTGCRPCLQIAVLASCFPIQSQEFYSSNFLGVVSIWAPISYSFSSVQTSIFVFRSFITEPVIRHFFDILYFGVLYSTVYAIFFT